MEFAITAVDSRLGLCITHARGRRACTHTGKRTTGNHSPAPQALEKIRTLLAAMEDISPTILRELTATSAPTPADPKVRALRRPILWNGLGLFVWR